MSNNKQLNGLKRLFDNLSDADKNAFLKLLNKEETEILSEITQKVVSICPHCTSTHSVKNGTKCGSLQHLCRNCHKSFIGDYSTILYRLQKSLDVWQKYVQDMLDKLPLRHYAEICGIDIPTAFTWQHKILNVMQKMMDSGTFDSIVEADETFFRTTYKGNHKKFSNFRLPKVAKAEGTSTAKRSISKEQVRVPCGVNLDGKSIAIITNLSKPRLTDIQTVLDNWIEKDFVLVTDSLKTYQKLSPDMGLNHIRIPYHRHTQKVFHIQTANSCHSRLKEIILCIFHGVAIKYLNNPLVYHNFVKLTKELRKEKVEVLLNFICETFCVMHTSIFRAKP